MNTAYLQIPQSAVIDFLHTLPREQILDIFENLLVYSDDSALTNEEKDALNISMKELEEGELINWEDIR